MVDCNLIYTHHLDFFSDIFHAAPTAQNSHFRFINSFIQPSRVGSLVCSLITNSNLSYFSGNNENAATSLNGAISEDLQLPSTPSSTATPSSGGAGILTLPPGKKENSIGVQAEP